MVVAMEFVEADLFMFVLLFVEGGGMVVVDADRRWCVMLSKVYDTTLPLMVPCTKCNFKIDSENFRPPLKTLVIPSY